MTSTEGGRFLRVCLATAGLALAATALGGCNNGNKVSMDDLQRENDELRERNRQVEAALADAEDVRAALERERDELIDENGRLRGEMDSVQNRPTGFEGVAGATVEHRVGEIAVQVAGDVLFNSGQAALKSSAKKTLDEIASVIASSYPTNEIRIAGHTDSDPIKKSKWGTNERLSAERALAVEEYLASKGIDKDRMYIAGYGPSKARGSKKESRRVEIVILR